MACHMKRHDFFKAAIYHEEPIRNIRRFPQLMSLDVNITPCQYLDSDDFSTAVAITIYVASHAGQM